MTVKEQTEALLAGMRSALGITWDEEQTNTQLKGMIARGIAYLNEIAGSELDYQEECKGRELLITYCLYARSNALDQFAENYLQDLTGFQLSEEVRLHNASHEATALP